MFKLKHHEIIFLSTRAIPIKMLSVFWYLKIDLITHGTYDVEISFAWHDAIWHSNIVIPKGFLFFFHIDTWDVPYSFLKSSYFYIYYYCDQYH